VNETAACPVNSHNEWDPLEEVIVGRLEEAMLPDAQLINRHTFPLGDEDVLSEIMSLGGFPYPQEMIEAADRDLNQFIHILESEGVTVRRPDLVDYSLPFRSPTWKAPSGASSANPRDPFIVVGDQIIETPMADRSRFFEAWAFRSLFKEYFRAGARWVSAPRPQLTDELYKPGFQSRETGDENIEYVLTEFEPAFDAADFVRCGRDIIGQKSHVTNQIGIDWLQRHLGDEYRVHAIQSRSPQAMHIDTTVMPLAPGKMLINPDWVDVDNFPAAFKDWDLLPAPRPVEPDREEIRLMSKWANMNMLAIGDNRIICEERQEPMIQALKGWGFTPIPCPFESYHPFLGSFHCATLDIRRTGELRSYT